MGSGCACCKCCKGHESLEEEEYVLRIGRARKDLPYHRKIAVTRRPQRYVIIRDDLYLKDIDVILKTHSVT
mgnify:CR=1 FL=1